MGNRPASTVQATLLDCDHSIGVVVSYGDKRKAFRLPNPFSAEINADWREDHPNFMGAEPARPNTNEVIRDLVALLIPSEPA